MAVHWFFFGALACLPQQVGHRSAARLLPAEHSLCVLELPPIEVLARRRHRIAQLAVFQQPSVRGFLRLLANNDADLALFLARAQVFRDFLAVGDRGLTLAMLMPPRPQLPFSSVLLLSASRPRALRRGGPLLKRFLFGPSGKVPDDLVLEEEPFEDTPLFETRIRTAPSSQSWQPFVSLRWAPRGFTGGLAWCWTYPYGRDVEAVAREHGRILPLVLTPTRKSRGGDRLDPGMRPAPAPPGEFLARFLFRVRAAVRSPSHPPAERKRLAAYGLEHCLGLEDLLWLEDGAVRERMELRVEEGRIAVLTPILEGLRAKAATIPAEALPENLLGAFRLSADLKSFEAALAQDPGFTAGELEIVKSLVRGLLGRLGRVDPAKDARSATVVVGFLPPGPGALLPEPILVAPAGPSDDPVRGLERIAGFFKSAAGIDPAKKPDLKRFGRRAPVVHYVDLVKLAGWQGNLDAIGLRLLNGAKVAAAKRKEWVYYASNPRTLKSALRALDAGRHLGADRARALADPDAAVAGFIDFKDFFGRLHDLARFGFLALAPFVFVRTGGMVAGLRPVAPARGKQTPGAGGRKTSLPDVREISTFLGEERLRIYRRAFGLSVEHEGGTMLSPAAWMGVAFAADLWDSLSALID